MRLPDTIDELIRFSGGDSSEIDAVFDKFYKVQTLADAAGLYEPFISESSIKNLDKKIRLLTALQNGTSMKKLGLEQGKPNFKILFEDYPTDSEVII